MITTLVPFEAKVLILGCGNAGKVDLNSAFSEQMYDAGYHQIWNMDISSVVIEQMSERNKDRIDMKWDVMDV